MYDVAHLNGNAYFIHQYQSIRKIELFNPLERNSYHFNLFIPDMGVFHLCWFVARERVISNHAVLTLMVFKFLLYLSSPNFPSGFAFFVFDVNQ